MSSPQGRYLRVCHVTEIRKLLSATVVLVTKMRRFFQGVEARDRLSLTEEERAFEAREGEDEEETA